MARDQSLDPYSRLDEFFFGFSEASRRDNYVDMNCYFSNTHELLAANVEVHK